MKKIKQLSILLIICLCVFVGIHSTKAITKSELVPSLTTASYISSEGYSNLYFQYVGVEVNNVKSQHADFCLNEGHSYKGFAAYYPTNIYHNQGYACALLSLNSQGKSDILAKLNNNLGLNGRFDEDETLQSYYETLQLELWEYNSGSTCGDKIYTGCSGTISSVKIGTNSVSYELEGDYYISNKISVGYSGSNNYSITLSNAPAGSIVVDSKTSTQNITSTKSGGLYIKIPKSSVTSDYSNIKLTLTPPSVPSTCKKNNAYVYEYAYFHEKCSGTLSRTDANGNTIKSCGPSDNFKSVTGNDGNGSLGNNGGFQYLSLLHFNSETPSVESDEIVSSLNANSIPTKISKKDITNEKELVGAHIVITDEADNIRAEYDSTEEPHEFYLGPGKYKLKETVAPEGYDLVETVFEFEILKNGNVKLLSTESEYFKTDKNEIILYNKVTEVPVPDTFKTNIMLSIIGIALSIAGAIIVIITLRRRKINEI